MKTIKLLLALFFVCSLTAQVKYNEIDTLSNLALLEDVKISGNIVNGRGKVSDILYNPKTKDFATSSKFAEYGVPFGKTDSLVLSFQWETPKLINYITFGGCYPNQPQAQSTYNINILSKGKWTTIAKGVGGWLNNGFFEWQIEHPIEADAVVIELYGVSIHLRGLKEEQKACLIQLLPYEKETVENVAEDIIKANSILLNELVKMKSEINALKKKIDVLKARISNLHSNE
jgi:hypothetical protein